MARRSYKIEDQVYYVLQNINLCDDKDKRVEIYNSLSGESKDSVGKREFKNIGESGKYIFSRNTMKNTLIQSHKFTNYCKDNFGIKKLVEITPSMCRDYLQSRKDEGASPNTLNVIKNSILKLDSGIQSSYSRNQGSIYTDEVKNFDVGVRQGRDRIYSSEDIKSIVENIGENSKYGDAFKVQLDLGLRVSEVINIKSSDITIGRGEVIDTAKFGHVDTSNTVRIQGKGGLVRYVEIPSDRIDFYQRLKDSSDGKVFNTSRNYLRQVFYRACDRLGLEKTYRTHEIRKEYARLQVQDKVLNFREREGREPSHQELYNIKAEVVSSLGHGRDRSDLIKVYCS